MAEYIATMRVYTIAEVALQSSKPIVHRNEMLYVRVIAVAVVLLNTDHHVVPTTNGMNTDQGHLRMLPSKTMHLDR